MKKILLYFEEIVASFFLVILLCLTIFNVGLRFTTGRSLAWTEEISYLCFAWVVFIGASAVYKRNMHSSIDLIMHFLPQKAARVLAFVTTLIMLAAIAFVSYLSIDFTRNAYTKLTSILYIPYTYIDLSITLGFVLMTIHSVVRLRTIWLYEDYARRPLYAGMENDTADDAQKMEEAAA